MLRLPLCFQGKKGKVRGYTERDELGLQGSRAWTCGCGLGVLGEVRAQKLLEQAYWQVGVATQAPDQSLILFKVLFLFDKNVDKRFGVREEG